MAERRELEVRDSRQLTSQSSSSAVVKFLRGLAEDRLDKFQRSKIYLSAFNISEREIRDIDRICNQLIGQIENSELEFSGTVRFTDLSTRKFDSLDILLSNSANDREPESLFLRWKTFQILRDGSVTYGDLDIAFVTEKMLVNEETGPGEFARASIKLTVAGSKDEWVDHSFVALQPFIESSKISKLFRWMNIFRNKWSISTVQFILAWLGFMAGMVFSSRWVSGVMENNRQNIINYILSPKNIDEQFARFVNNEINPASSPWYLAFLPFALGLLLYGILHLGGLKFIPKFAPRSTIAIGLSGRTIRDTRNLFRFIIVDLIIISVILPIILAFLRLT